MLASESESLVIAGLTVVVIVGGRVTGTVTTGLTVALVHDPHGCQLGAIS